MYVCMYVYVCNIHKEKKIMSKGHFIYDGGYNTYNRNKTDFLFA